MKNYPKIITFVSLFIFLISASCKKEKLTKETQTGANTFSCKINGKIYTAKTDLFSPKFTGGFYTNNLIGSGELSLFASIGSYDSSSQQFDLRMKFPKINRLGIYSLDQSNFFEISKLPYTIDGKSYTTIVSNNGTLNITFIDYQNSIISGTFSFTAINTNDNSDQLMVSEGRFDIQTQ